MNEQEKLKQLGKNIARIRRANRMSQGVLSEHVGISREHLAKIETSKKGLSISVLFRIAEVLNVKESDLLDFD